jgi:hypothetical protein
MSVERFYPRKKAVAPRSLRRIHGDVGQSGKRNSNEEIRPILECASENRGVRLGLIKIAAHILKGRIRKSPDIHLLLAVHGPRAISIWRSLALSHNTGNPVISALVAPFALLLVQYELGLACAGSATEGRKQQGQDRAQGHARKQKSNRRRHVVRPSTRAFLGRSRASVLQISIVIKHRVRAHGTTSMLSM